MTSGIILAEGDGHLAHAEGAFDYVGGFAGFSIQHKNLVCFQSGEGHAITQQNTHGGNGGDARSRSENADEVQWISATNCDQLAFASSLAKRAQRTDRFGQCKLFAANTADKIATANFTACFKASK